MEVLSNKGDISESLQDLINDKTKITIDDDTLNQVLIEIIMTKFKTNVLEHI